MLKTLSKNLKTFWSYALHQLHRVQGICNLVKNFSFLADALFGMEFLPPVKAIWEKGKQLRTPIGFFSDQQFLSIFAGHGINLVNTLQVKIF